MNSEIKPSCNCKTWARIPTDNLPMSEHNPRCEHYKLERFLKVTFEGNYLIIESHDAHDYNDEGMVHEDIFMTRDQFERLPEFDGF